MKQVTFITSNQNKADYLARLIGIDIKHTKIDLEEIQSTDLHTIVEHKVRQAYQLINQPVLVEDVSLEFSALNGLPGPFIKFFIEQTGLDSICKMLTGFSDRSATAKCTFGYYDGNTIMLFDGQLAGTVAIEPRGENGFGWDRIFIPEGYNNKTRAELNQADNDRTYQIIKPFEQLRTFFNKK